MTGWRPDLHRLSRPDLAAELVQDILTRKVEERQREAVAEQLETLRRRQRPWLYWIFGLLPILGVLVIWNLVRRAEAPPVFRAEELDASVRLKIFLTAKAIYAYRDSTRRFPASLAELGMRDIGLVYERTATSFTITDTSAVLPLTYYSGDDLTIFSSAYQQLSAPRRSGS
jgi:hypothetical protein